MATLTHGVFFIGRNLPTRSAVRTRLTEDGDFVIQLRVVDNQGPLAKESYVVRWTGEQAQAFHTAHPNLKAGDPLRLILENPRSLPGLVAPEIHATVLNCELLPARHTATA